MNIVHYKNYGKPLVGYDGYDWPYSSQHIPGTKAKFHLQVLTGTASALDGATLVVPVLLTPTQLSPITLTFDDDTVPPSTASAINISGLATAAAIAEQIALSLTLIGLEVVQDSDDLYVTQSFQGSLGNSEIESTGLDDVVAINGVIDYAGFNVFFWDGGEQTPQLWGPQRGFRSTTVPSVPSSATPV